MNKGDDENPVYRSRMVGNEFNDKAIDGLFAATPPLEALSLLLRWAATVEAKGIGSFAGARGHGKRKGILIADVSRAFFEAPQREGTCASTSRRKP